MTEKPKGKLDVVVGLQWGDEGKGKIVQYMLSSGKYSFCARYQGAGNAGHTVYDHVDGNKVVLHNVPTGIIYDKMECYMGNGELVDLGDLVHELECLGKAKELRGRLHISDRAHVIFPYLKELEVVSGAAKKRGTTKHGIGPAYMIKAARQGLRTIDMSSSTRVREIVKDIIGSTIHTFPAERRGEFDERKITEEQMRLLDAVLKYANIEDTSYSMNKLLERGKSGIAEGAQGTGLDVDHGTYPDVTSSNATAGGACTGLGVGPNRIGKVIGIAKAYVTRVGTGPFPTLMPPKIEEEIRQKGGEFGATTGRPRRCGWWDSVLAEHAVRVNGVSEIILTKPDVLTGLDAVFACTSYRHHDNKNGRVGIFPADLKWRDESIENSSNYEGVMSYIQKGWGEIMRGSRLHENLRKYIDFIEETSGAPVTIVSVGPKMKDTIEL